MEGLGRTSRELHQMQSLWYSASSLKKTGVQYCTVAVGGSVVGSAVLDLFCDQPSVFCQLTLVAWIYISVPFMIPAQTKLDSNTPITVALVTHSNLMEAIFKSEGTAPGVNATGVLNNQV
jgi:hypothetical protein